MSLLINLYGDANGGKNRIYIIWKFGFSENEVVTIGSTYDFSAIMLYLANLL